MNARNPWQLYEDLIDLLPADVTVTDLAINRVAIVENSAGGMGTASGDRGGRGDRSVKPLDLIGAPLRDVASLSRSWDFQLASLGVAALNSWLNTAERVHAAAQSPYIAVDQADIDVFAAHAESLRGQKVALIGHFSQGIAALSDTADLTVIERDPHSDDLPDSACEYVLPQMDAVFITGMTVANKTLPRLLELASGSRVFLVGPSVPCAPEVFAGKVQHIASSYISDLALARSLAAVGSRTPGMRPAMARFRLDVEAHS